MARKGTKDQLTPEERAKAAERRAVEETSRPMSVTVRFSQGELATLKAESEKTGMNYSDLIRSKVVPSKK